MTDVFLNNRLIGFCENPREFVERIRQLRRAGELPPELNVAYHEDEDIVVIFTEKGRARRPLIIVEGGKSKLTPEILERVEKGELTWDDLISMGVIEYLDAEEEENCLVAMDESELTKRHTHLEITPLAMLGILTSLIPFVEHNQAFRALLGPKSLEQGLGLYVTNFLIRADTDSSFLVYPQRPIVRTMTQDYVGYDSHPIGQNVVIAVMQHYGYNMQDAIVVNKGSIERGFGRSTYYRPYKSEELRYPGGQVDKIEIPSKDIRGYKSEESYRFLEKDGIIYPEVEVKAGDVLIGKTSPPRFLEGGFRVTLERKETSEVVKFAEKGIVENVIITESAEGNKLVKVKVRDDRVPELGDKFASRHGQKGVIGMIVPQEDMPFTASGIVPDIIFSPQSLPSRLSFGHMLEILAGKVGALDGRYVDGTPWNDESEFDLRKKLLELGFRDNGTETMYDGISGKMYKVRIFIGNMYYLKLRHMVAGKIQARARGAMQLLTRQPTEGRSKEGGLRLGEMEKDCLVAHGASLLLKERFDSDRWVIPVCKNCGLVAVYNRPKNKYFCPVCGADAPITLVEVSYAFKLLLDELKSLCIYPKLILKPKGE